jgi:hypothetical protein
LTNIGCSSAVLEDEETEEAPSEVITFFYQHPSGLFKLRIKQCDYNTTSHTSNRNVCPMDFGWALIGGGAEVKPSPAPKAVLRGSFPNPDPFNGLPPNTSWVGRSWSTSSHQLRVYAIGLQLDGLSPEELEGNIFRVDNTTPLSQNPTIDAPVNPGYTLIGGGANVVPDDVSGATPAALELTGSRPAGNAWRATAKNNRSSATGAIKSYVIGIHACPPEWGGQCLQLLQPQITSATKTGTITVSGTTAPGSVLASVGGFATQQSGGVGRYLSGLVPVNPENFTVRSTDFGGTDNSKTTAAPVTIGIP